MKCVAQVPLAQGVKMKGCRGCGLTLGGSTLEAEGSDLSLDQRFN